MEDCLQSFALEDVQGHCSLQSQALGIGARKGGALLPSRRVIAYVVKDEHWSIALPRD